MLRSAAFAVRQRYNYEQLMMTISTMNDPASYFIMNYQFVGSNAIIIQYRSCEIQLGKIVKGKESLRDDLRFKTGDARDSVAYGILTVECPEKNAWMIWEGVRLWSWMRAYSRIRRHRSRKREKPDPTESRFAS